MENNHPGPRPASLVWTIPYLFAKSFNLWIIRNKGNMCINTFIFHVKDTSCAIFSKMWVISFTFF